ncbi:hypothetical protein M0R45_000318 [Rubus argutus]|uniref:MHC class I antigen n=1 Tax=Rubus argutus TaxID=59490 RepID=A0AAW1VPL9_RUBAR
MWRRGMRCGQTASLERVTRRRRCGEASSDEMLWALRDRARLDGQSSEGVDADWALVTTPRAGEIRQRW